MGIGHIIISTIVFDKHVCEYQIINQPDLNEEWLLHEAYYVIKSISPDLNRG